MHSQYALTKNWLYFVSHSFWSPIALICIQKTTRSFDWEYHYQENGVKRVGWEWIRKENVQTKHPGAFCIYKYCLCIFTYILGIFHASIKWTMNMHERVGTWMNMYVQVCVWTREWYVHLCTHRTFFLCLFPFSIPFTQRLCYVHVAYICWVTYAYWLSYQNRSERENNLFFFCIAFCVSVRHKRSARYFPIVYPLSARVLSKNKRQHTVCPFGFVCARARVSDTTKLTAIQWQLAVYTEIAKLDWYR